jgi:hypothetical protein
LGVKKNKENNKVLSEDRYFKTLTKDELWQRYCGFLDLTADRFVEIQEKLLMDQIDLIADSVLGKKIMNNQKPESLDEFRRMIPLTTYEDYEPYLTEKREDVLGEKPYIWCHSAGRMGEFKWIPQSREIIEKAVRYYLAALILASTSKKGEINIKPGTRLLAVAGPPPYASGMVLLNLIQSFSTKLMPPTEETEKMAFVESIKTAFKMALRDGVDVIGAIASTLVRMGEEFSGQTSSMKFSVSMLNPKVIFRLLRAVLRSKKAKRGILPKDIWQPKGILVGGVDTSIYKEGVLHYWGVGAHEVYSGTEGLAYAVQAWNREGLVFFPDTVFLEFIPYTETPDDQEIKYDHPDTLLLNELEEGELYEIVISNFYGMPLLRFRINDVIKVISIKDDETGINLPQIAFQRRVGDVINLGGLCWLDEKTIWQVLVNTGIKFTEWTARKEYEKDKTLLRIYLELKEDKEPAELELMIDEQLKKIDINYIDIHTHLGLQPVRVTLLKPGTFQQYMEEKIEEGANLAHLKPAHINATETIIQHLMELSSRK